MQNQNHGSNRNIKKTTEVAHTSSKRKSVSFTHNSDVNTTSYPMHAEKAFKQTEYPLLQKPAK